jgi:hypothetical protein
MVMKKVVIIFFFFFSFFVRTMWNQRNKTMMQEQPPQTRINR